MYDLHYGFWKRRSYETQFIQLAEDFARNLTSGTQTDIVLDFNKAFDKVSHLRLLYKLRKHGVRGNSLKWVSSI